MGWENLPLRIVRVGNQIRFTFTNEELSEVKNNNSLDVSIGLLRVLFVDITNIISNMMPKLKKGKTK